MKKSKKIKKPEFDYPKIRKRYLKLYSALCYDMLESEFGLPNQALSASIKPLDPKTKVAGPAFTAKGSTSPDRERKGLSIEMIQQFQKDCVVVLDTGHDNQVAHWGEIMSTASRGMGCVGAVIDGACRDSNYVIKMKFPVFIRYQTPVEAFGRTQLIDWQTPIMMPGILTQEVIINPGDYIFGDIDGVIVIPKHLTLKLLEKAEERMALETKVRNELKAGKPPLEVYKKYGVF
jgi:regulator of RNase E activity RraA